MACRAPAGANDVRSAIVRPPGPVSPELVLVDPELARRQRARLTEQALRDALAEIRALQRRLELRANPVEASAEPSTATPRRHRLPRRRLVPAGMLGFAMVVAVLLVGGSGERSAAAESVAPGSTPGHGALAVRTPPRREVDPRTRLERRIVSLIRIAPRSKLPRTFVDRRTGRPRQAVSVACRARARKFVCVARVPADSPDRGILVTVRYRQDGRSVFAWAGYGRVRGRF